jgi:hypothetical protein
LNKQITGICLLAASFLNQAFCFGILGADLGALEFLMKLGELFSLLNVHW